MSNVRRLTTALLAELHAFEEDSYRLALRTARRLGSGYPATTLRAVAGHAGEALHELPSLALPRHVRLHSLGALLLDTTLRARDVLLDRILDREHSYRRALASMRRGIDLVRLTLSAAREEGDEGLVAWCGRWMHARQGLVADVADGLDWFAMHPSLARLARA